MERSNVPKVGLSHVMKVFWEGVRPQKWSAFFTLFAYTLTSLIHLTVPLYYKKFFDLLSTPNIKDLLATQLIHLLLIILIIKTVQWIFYRTGTHSANNFVSQTMARLKQMSFDYMIQHSYSFFTNNFSGSLVQKVNRFSRSFEKLYDTLMYNVVPLIIQVIGAMWIVYFQEPVISYIIIAWSIVILIFGYFFSKWKLKYDLEAAKADSTTTGFLADTISNQNNVSSFTGFSHESSRFKSVTNNQGRLQRLTWDLSHIEDAIQAGFIVMIEFLLFYYAVKFWQQDLITVGTFVLIQVYVFDISHRLWDFGRVIKTVYESFAESKEMVEILETPYEIRDIPTATELGVENGNITFRDVQFNYNETRSVIENLNLEIKGGQKVALIGPSGAGKSTIVKLLLRMYDLTAGSILIDEQIIKDVTQESLRRNISLVPQDPVLFHRTLLENIRYGRLDATDEEVFEAAKLAHCDEFIDVLPLKYETYVGERGIKLSGGERQRVAIARAILKNAPILILDEATSSLDSHSESLIQDALDRLMKGKTSIVIAHRLSTIRKMDRIIVVDGGKITEDGNHENLLAQENGLYKKLWDLQAGGFLVEAE